MFNPSFFTSGGAIPPAWMSPCDAASPPPQPQTETTFSPEAELALMAWVMAGDPTEQRELANARIHEGLAQRSSNLQLAGLGLKAVPPFPWWPELLQIELSLFPSPGAAPSSEGRCPWVGIVVSRFVTRPLRIVMCRPSRSPEGLTATAQVGTRVSGMSPRPSPSGERALPALRPLTDFVGSPRVAGFVPLEAPHAALLGAPASPAGGASATEPRSATGAPHGSR